MPDKEGAIRLVSVEGENIRTLTTIAVRLDGKPGLYRVTGENEAGKTTFLDVVAMLFGGKSAVKPDTIQEGKDGAWCRGELSNGYRIERRFTAAAPDGYLDVITPDQASKKSPQTVLDGWCGPHSWDPGALLRKRTSEIEGIILNLAERPGLREELQAIRESKEALKDQRKPFNSILQKFQRSRPPAGTRPEPVDVSAEMARFQALQEDAEERASLQRAVEVAKSAQWEAAERVTELEGNIQTLEAELRTLRSELKSAEEGSLQAQKALRASEERLTAFPNPSAEIDAVASRLSEADDVSRALAPWLEWDRMEKEAKEAKKAADKITKDLAAVDEKEREALTSANIPVRGISFGEEGDMLLDGHPIEVASGMRRLDMAVDIAISANPDVRICLLDEANDYGLPALERLNERAMEHGFQVLACRLGLEGPGEIIVKDGSAIGPE